MDLTFYKFNKRINSTKIPNDLTEHITVNVTLKEPCTFDSPVFTLLTDVTEYSYFKWDNRYYFISKKTYIRQHMYEIEGSIDALGTYRSQIRSSTQFIERSNVVYDDYLIDGMYPTKAFPTVSLIEQSMDFVSDITDGTYITAIKSEKGIKYYPFTNSELLDLLEFMFTQKQDNLWANIVDSLQSMYANFINVADYLVSCTWVPFAITGDLPSEPVYFGYWDSGLRKTSLSAKYIHSTVLTFDISEYRHTESHTLFLDSNNYKSMSLFLPGLGQYRIDCEKANSNYILVNMRMDRTGRVIGKITGVPSSKVLANIEGNFGVNVPLSDNAPDLNGVIALTSAVIATVTKGAAGAALSVGGAISAVNNTVPEPQTRGGQGSYLIKSAFPNAELVITQYNITTQVPEIYGYPAMQKSELSFDGYYKVIDPQIDFCDELGEKQSIISYMQQGFYAE